MITLTAASKVFKLFEGLLKLITHHQELTRKNFDEVITPLFKELEKVVSQYHKILWELDRDIRLASSHDDIAVALEKAYSARDTFLMARAKVLGQLSGTLKFREDGSHDMSLVKPGTGQLLFGFAQSINHVFRSPVCRVYTHMSYEFEEILKSETIADLNLRKGVIESSLQNGIQSLTDAWQMTCENYGMLLSHYKKL